jgi:microcystin-dependent protein
MVVIINGTDGVDTPAINAGNIVGQVCFFGMTTPPSGFLACDGAPVSRAQYVALFTAIGTTYGAGDGSTTFNLPDLRGEFVRGLDSGRGVDSGRGLGTAQTDAFQGHRSGIRGAGPLTGTASGASSVEGILNSNGAATTSTWSGDLIADGTNGTPRTASETRPRNVALLACIKF